MDKAPGGKPGSTSGPLRHNSGSAGAEQREAGLAARTAAKTWDAGVKPAVLGNIPRPSLLRPQLLREGECHGRDTTGLVTGLRARGEAGLM